MYVWPDKLTIELDGFKKWLRIERKREREWEGYRKKTWVVKDGLYDMESPLNGCWGTCGPLSSYVLTKHLFRPYVERDKIVFTDSRDKERTHMLGKWAEDLHDSIQTAVKGGKTKFTTRDILHYLKGA